MTPRSVISTVLSPLFTNLNNHQSIELHAGRWYRGMTDKGETGLVARWTGYAFENSSCADLNEAMCQYPRIVELAPVNTAEAAPPTNQDLVEALRWLETLVKSPTVPWSAGQKDEAGACLDRAKRRFEALTGLPG